MQEQIREVNLLCTVVRASTSGVTDPHLYYTVLPGPENVDNLNDQNNFPCGCWVKGRHFTKATDHEE